MSRESDILVIGAGAVGLACAYFLNRAGRSVRVIDRDEPGRGTSFGNCGLITPSHATPMCSPTNLRAGVTSIFSPAAPLHVRPRLNLDFLRWVSRYSAQCTTERASEVMAAKAELLRSSRALMERLIRKEKLHCEWSPSGLLAVANSGKGLASLERLAEEAARVDVATQVVDATAARELEPALLDTIVGGVLFPDDAVLRPDLYCTELARVCREKGVRFEKEAEVDGIRVGDAGEAHAISTAKDVYRAPIVVFATGVWSRSLLRQIGFNAPIEPGKGYTLTSARPNPCPTRALLLEERRIAVTPWGDSFRLGGTMEFAGFDEGINRHRVDALIEGAAEYLGEPLAPGKPEAWAGFRPMTPDDLPLIGPLEDQPGLFLACGHNMLGMSMSVATGRLIAELVLRRKPHLDPAPYAPNRFARQPANPLVGLVRQLSQRD
ncbi:MAG: FAD-dependent oxidoreductase [Xanthomonadales bacterium]|nr:FAD-dependent oxidoreductase [Xanthomonadales bacterium]